LRDYEVFSTILREESLVFFSILLRILGNLKHFEKERGVDFSDNSLVPSNSKKSWILSQLSRRKRVSIFFYLSIDLFKKFFFLKVGDYHNTYIKKKGNDGLKFFIFFFYYLFSFLFFFL
jgi:hypothetical protein